MNASRFWIVCNPQRAVTPRPYTHSTYELAEAEAKRLAETFPGQVFHVMASATAFTKQTISQVRFNEDQTEHDGEIPF